MGSHTSHPALRRLLASQLILAVMAAGAGLSPADAATVTHRAPATTKHRPVTAKTTTTKRKPAKAKTTATTKRKPVRAKSTASTKSIKAPVDTDPAHRYIPIGTAVNLPALDGPNPLYRQTLNANFTSVTPENEMKWTTTEPANGVFNFGPADQIVSYALAHHMSVHGHNLVWNNALPHWLLAGTWTKAQLEAILKLHIQTEVSHFAGEVNEWDVINEPFTNTGALVNNIWMKVIGPGYIALALQWAHQADPSAKLFINDYNIDWPGPREQAMMALARSLLAAGVPLSGMGMEEHLSVNWSPSVPQLTEAMSDFASLGLDIEVTEADVETDGYPGTPAQAQAQQTAVFAELAQACRAQLACTRFTVWGVSDAVSWLGSAEAGLPFSVNYTPKPAWAAITGGLANMADSAP